MLTSAILLAMLFSTMKVGILPPGVLEVAMRHSVFPFSSSVKRSTLTYLPFMAVSSSIANSGWSERSTGIDTISLET